MLKRSTPNFRQNIRPDDIEGLFDAARTGSQAGGGSWLQPSDVQQLAGHSGLATTQRYIEGDTEAKRKLVNLL